MLRILLLGLALAFASTSSHAQTVELQSILQENEKAVARASRKTVSTVIDALIASKLPEAQTFLTNWQEKNVWQRKEDKLFFYVETDDKKTYRLIDVASGDTVGEVAKKELKQLKPNSGVRGVIAAALVQFQLLDEDVLVRQKALAAIERRAEESHLEALRGSIEEEPLPALRARKERLERLLTIRFDKDENARVEAIKSFAGDLGVDVRAALNPILAVKLNAEKSVPETANVANVLSVGSQISQEDAYSFLAERELAPMRISKEARDAVLVANIVDRKVADIPVTQLNTEKARRETYEKLAKASNGEILPFVSEEVIEKTLGSYTFFNVYNERSSAVTTAAKATLDGIESKLGFYQFLDLALDGLSLTSIYFLAAIGLAITFGVMGVINMAHGEFIMIGAYTGYVVQLFIPDYTISILVALPLAFIIAFAFGVAMERTVIRHLASRPLETLLATFGISIALQQIAKNIFGTQARPLTSPAWLDGAWALNDVVSISYIRIAIFILAIVFFLVLLFILNKTRLGLEVRAVTQNPRMAASMGINPDKINMLTFGLGSGIAGIAGVAIGLFAKVTSELGSAYIVQSFMTVVVGGVGNIWGTAAGATMIGSLQKGIEWFNPSNTLAAQTYMIIFIIIFIQFRPKGIIALKGRAAGD